MRISFDVDGVLADLTPSVVRRANRLWPGKFPYGYNMQQQWNFADVLTERQWEVVWADCMSTPDFWCEPRAFAAEVQAVKRFLDFEGAPEAFFVTSRKAPKTAGAFDAEQQTRYWLSAVGLGAYAKDHIVVTKDSIDKANTVHRLRIRYHIDDLMGNVVACDKVPGHHSFLLDRPWNQNMRVPNVQRVTMNRFLSLVGTVNHINAGRFD